MLQPNSTSLACSIFKLMQHQNLDAGDCEHALSLMLEQDANELQSAAFLVLLRAKTETTEELFGLTQALRYRMRQITVPYPVLDIVGTGGDGSNTINISTASAILAASCGVKIIKHGNRAVSSKSGSADVLEALGIDIHLSFEAIVACVEQLNIGFCFAPRFNEAFAKLRSVRHQLHVPTTLNVLGPLLNPARPAYFLLGVHDQSLLYPMAETMQRLGVQRGMVVHGSGLDELSCLGSAHVVALHEGTLHETHLDPLDYGLRRCQLHELQGGHAEQNAKIIHDVFSRPDSRTHRAIAETLIFNAAVAIHIVKNTPVAAAVDEASVALHRGLALSLLNRWKDYSYAPSY